jgi:hypothetical protein
MSSTTTTTSVDECIIAMNDASISDDALVSLFLSCDFFDGLVHSAVLENNERAVRLLINADFDLTFDYDGDDESGGSLLHVAYEHASLAIIDLLVGPLNDSYLDFNG